MYFAKRIKEERMKLNLTQQQLAEKIHISRQSISKWERGESYPTIETLIDLSDLFEVTIDELLKGDHSLKNKIIEDGKQLAYPKWKAIFDAIFLIGAAMIIMKIGIAFGNRVFDWDITYFKDSLFWAFGPFIITITAGIFTDTLGKKFKE
ncbi:helix-turn-helix domain-containing protein [Solibacillus sp. MA9]|uniref:Helix-turn-helix domain-containing protein n=1 Tax=Solibacillus palustris TaxID=2908203 RepID=A0ABS9UJ79_9BACL|nr:helix-turn-helix transcriptional regulator [Solibacillus sp. MA9]MCH7323980.1 helix-turn-helix domain-containing protein [Solibacillus sp. MA9]